MLKAGTTATFDLTRFQVGNSDETSSFSATATTIVGSNDSDGDQPYQTISLTATGPVTLTGYFHNTSLQAANLTVTPNSDVEFTTLNTGGATGTVVIGDGSTFLLSPATSTTAPANSVGPITFDGSSTVTLNASLAVAGGISVTNSDQTPLVVLGLGQTLTVTGSVALGAGGFNGEPGSALSTNSNVTTTGDFRADTANVYGGVTAGTLEVRTLTSQKINGVANANPPATTVAGNVSSFAPGGTNTFTIGQLTAGGLSFGASANSDGSLNASSLTLGVTGNFGVGAGGVPGFVTSADFSGGAIAATSSGGVGGSGGALVVTTTANTTAGTAGSIRVQDNGTGTIPVVNANGGAFAPTANGITGTGGTGGQIVFNAAAGIGVGNAVTPATLSAAGGGYAINGGQTTYTGGGATDGGAGGTITLNAGNNLTLTGTANAGFTMLNARGGNVLNSNSGSGGHGGTVNLLAAGAVTLLDTQADARGGDDTGATIVGNAPGGTISVSSGGATSTVTTVSITNSTLLASNGQTGNQLRGTGGTINLVSQDGTTGPAPNPTPVPAIRVSGSTLAVSQPGSTSAPSQPGSLNGGTVNVTSKRVGGLGISVEAASQLLAMVDPASTGTGGHVNLTTSGADIAVVGGSTVHASGPNSGVTISTGGAGTNGGTVTVNDASLSTANTNGQLTAGGTVSVTTGATAATGTSTINVANESFLAGDVISLQALGSAGAITIGGAGNSTNIDSTFLSADTLKMQALGANGAITINGGSTLSAATQLTLYATGSNGAITFQGGNITLNTGTLAGILAARMVTVATGTTVTANGSQTLEVYTNNANFAASSGGTGTGQQGTFTGTATNNGVVTVSPLAAAPTPPTTSAVKGGRPVQALTNGSRVVAVGPGFTLVATKAAVPEGPALPAGFTRRETAAGSNPTPGKSAAELRRRPTPANPLVTRPGSGIVTR